MGRGLKVGIGIAVVLVGFLVVNAIVVGNDTDGASVTEPGGLIVNLPDAELQVRESGRPGGTPIVLLHCFSCAMNYWDGMRPALERNHRVVTIDLLGHGGSEKPRTGYTPQNQAKLVAEALRQLRIRDAEIVGHSLGGSVAVALAERAPGLVDRVVIIDMPPDTTYGDLGFIAGLAFQPVIGPALWTIKPDFSVRQGLEVAFAPGYDVPDAFVDDVNRLTYTAYDETPSGIDEYVEEKPLDRRLRATGKPLMVLMGAEEQIVNDPQRALDQYASAIPGTETHLIAGAGHSPNVEKPAKTAALVLAFGTAARDRGKVAKASTSP